VNPFKVGDRVRYKQEFDPTDARTKGTVIESLSTIVKVRWDREEREFSGESLAVHHVRLQPVDVVELLGELA